MTVQLWEKKGVEKIFELRKTESEYSFGNVPHDQVVFGEKQVWNKILILKKKESEYIFENAPHDEVVLG